jgi:hypothetical protein
MSARRGNSLIPLFLLLALAWPRPAIPCSSLVFLNKGFPVFGTNYDNRFAPGQLFITAAWSSPAPATRSPGAA